MSAKLQDQMTPAERAKAIAAGGPADRLPCNPNVANGVARVYGCKISEFNTSAEVLAEAQIASYQRFGYDSVRIFTDLFPWAEAMGAKVKKPEDDTVDLLEPALADPADYERLEPADPYHDGRLPVQLEAMRILNDRVGDELGCSAAVCGPFTNACFLVGVQKLLKMCYRQPEIVHALCQVSLDTMIAYADAAIDTGLSPTISEPMSSCTVVSPRIFHEFSEPYLRQLVDHIRGRGKGTVMHICGQTSGIWESIADMDVAAFSIDNVASIRECKEKIGSKTKILGNVNPGTTMYMGTPAEVRLETLQCIRDGYDSPRGFMPMSGCSLPVETPFENIDMMMDTVREVGYPVDPGKVDWMIAETEKSL